MFAGYNTPASAIRPTILPSPSSPSPSPLPSSSASASSSSVQNNLAAPPSQEINYTTKSDGVGTSTLFPFPNGSLPSRYSNVSNDSSVTTNPFINPDMPLIRTAQGYVSGGTIGFRTGAHPNAGHE